jgi:hypothetical protein
MTNDSISNANRALLTEFWTPERKIRHRELFVEFGDWGVATRQLFQEAKGAGVNHRARWSELHTS